jgi:hypothetical protein
MMIDIIVRFTLKDYKGSIIRYGRRFLVESPDAVMKKYHDSISNHTPDTIKTEILTEYIQGYYGSDIETQVILEKAMIIEPYQHNSISEVLAYPVNEQIKLRKLHFLAFWKQYPKTSKLTKEIKQITKDFDKFISDEQITRSEIPGIPGNA